MGTTAPLDTVTEIRRLPKALFLPYRFLSPAILAVTFFAVATRGHLIAGDSFTYIDAAVFRTPLYPLFLDLVELAAPDHSLAVAAILQLAFGLLAADALVRLLRRLTPMSDLTAIVFLLLFLYPYLGRLEVGTAIHSEGLAYPLYLLSTRFLLAALAHRSGRSFAFYLALCVAAVLTRPQFLFMLALTVPVLVYWLHRERSYRATFGLALLVVAAALLALLLDRTYHLWRHGSFVQIPFTGLQLMASALYLSDPADQDLLGDEQRALLAELQKRASGAGLTLRHNTSPGGLTAFSWHFRASYNDLAWRTIYPAMRERFDWKEELTPQDFIRMDHVLSSLALKVLPRHKKQWVKLYLSNIAASLGLTHSLLLLVALVASTIHTLRTRERVTLLFAAGSLAHLSNCAYTAAVMPLIARYTFYTELVFLVLATTVVLKLLGLGRGQLRQEGADRLGRPSPRGHRP